MSKSVLCLLGWRIWKQAEITCKRLVLTRTHARCDNATFAVAWPALSRLPNPISFACWDFHDYATISLFDGAKDAINHVGVGQILYNMCSL